MSTRVLQAARSAAFAVALAALVGTTSGQVKPRVKPLTLTLTPMDYIEIRQLVNRYAFAADTGSSNGYDYADLFAQDGEFVQPHAKGREQRSSAGDAHDPRPRARQRWIEALPCRMLAAQAERRQRSQPEIARGAAAYTEQHGVGSARGECLQPGLDPRAVWCAGLGDHQLSLR